jgi:hypothetical protein
MSSKEDRMSLISSITDSTISIIGKGIAKRMLHTIGDVTFFSYDSLRREVVLHITFIGEEDSTSIVLGDYVMKEAGGIVQLRFDRITTSTEWLNAAAEKFFRGRYLEVPEKFALEVKAIFGDHGA